MSSWDNLQRRAKYLEARLESKIQQYSSIAQKINADFLCDEENPLIGNKEEQEYSEDIERDLSELSDCINNMRTSLPAFPSQQNESLVKRFHEIHFDYTTEFKNISAAIQRKKQSMELFKSSKNSQGEEQDSSMARLLRERSSIAASMKSINDVISQAFETKNTLNSQRATLTGSGNSASNLSTSMPTFNRLIDGIQKKKARESAIIAAVIGGLICVTIWWLFLR